MEIKNLSNPLLFTMLVNMTFNTIKFYHINSPTHVSVQLYIYTCILYDDNIIKWNFWKLVCIIMFGFSCQWCIWPLVCTHYTDLIQIHILYLTHPSLCLENHVSKVVTLLLYFIYKSGIINRKTLKQSLCICSWTLLTFA